MRILKFIGAFLGTLLLILLIVFGFNHDTLFTLFNNSGDLQEGQEWVSKTTSLKGLTEYIGANPGRTAIVSRSVINPDTTIAYGKEEPHTLGTLSNFFLITAYARAVEDGVLDADTPIPLEKVDRHQLPYIDASNHENALSALEASGNISDDNTAPLHSLVQKALIYNDLAISDFLLKKLGTKIIEETYSELNLKQTDLPLPYAGLYITLNPVLNDTTFEAHITSLRNLSKKVFRDSVIEKNRRFLTDGKYRRNVIQTFTREKGVGAGFSERRDMLDLFPKSTAGELSSLMVKLEQDSLLSAAISRRIKDLMSWPYEQQSLNSDFKYYGAIYDNRLGLLNGIDYGASVYSGEAFGQAVFFDSLQVAFWFHMSSNLMHQDYQQRLMWDPALRTTTLQEIGK